MNADEVTDTVTPRRTLTTDEIALMRAIVEWRREAVGHWPRTEYYRRCWTMGGGDEHREVYADFPRVDDPADGYAVVSYCHGRYASLTHFEATSLTEGVDILVARGYLPVRFSSAYGAGWDARESFVRGEHNPDVERDFYGNDERLPVPMRGGAR